MRVPAHNTLNVCPTTLHIILSDTLFGDNKVNIMVTQTVFHRKRG